jgi:hypothetical protein
MLDQAPWIELGEFHSFEKRANTSGRLPIPTSGPVRIGYRMDHGPFTRRYPRTDG